MKKLICAVLSCAVLFCMASCKNETDKTSDTTITSDTEAVITSGDISESSSEPSYVEPIDIPIDIVESKLLYAWGVANYNEYLMKEEYTKEKNGEIGILNYAYLEMGEIDEDDSGNVKYAFKTEIFIVELDVKSDLYQTLSVGKDLRFYMDGEGSETFQVSAINAQYVLGIRVSEQKGEEKVTETKPDFTLGNSQKIYDAFIGLE